jgi:hypothetical protein
MSATPASARRSALDQVSQRWKTAVALGSVAVWRDRGTSAAGSMAISGTLSLVLAVLVAL